jgi:hypothetical protein
MTKTQQYKENREQLKAVAKEIRIYLKETGGTFGVKVQQNNVIWISGQYTFGVEYSERQSAETKFSEYLLDLADKYLLYFSDGPNHKYLKPLNVME